MPDKKTLDKAKKASAMGGGAAAMDKMDDMDDMEEKEGMAEDMTEAEMAKDEMDEGMGMDAGEEPRDAAGAVQMALDDGVKSAEEMMAKLMEAGFEIVPTSGADMGEPMPAEPPMGSPMTAGDLRERVRGAAARALGGMA